MVASAHWRRTYPESLHVCHGAATLDRYGQDYEMATGPSIPVTCQTASIRSSL